MNKFYRNLIIFSFLTFYFLLPVSVGAAGLVPCGGTGEPECNLCYLFLTIDRIIDFMLWKLAVPVAILFLVIGGLMFIVFAENEQKRSEAKNIITAVFLGLFIIFVSWAIIETIMNTLANPGAFPWLWHEIDCTP